MSKTLPTILAHSVQMETRLREGGGRVQLKPRALCPAHLPEIHKADDDPDERQPQPVEVRDTLGQPLHVHRHQVDHVPNGAGPFGATGQSQDLGRAGGGRPDLREGPDGAEGRQGGPRRRGSRSAATGLG